MEFASPWWVNLLILIPFVTFFVFRRKAASLLSGRTLFWTALFSISFGFIEASVVIYLRAALGLSVEEQIEILNNLPKDLLTLEILREAATMIMLLSIALALGTSLRERIQSFLWMFSFWDIFYYVWLKFTIGWPASFFTDDVLFLIPMPWLSEVWFPLTVSFLTILAVFSVSKHKK